MQLNFKTLGSGDPIVILHGLFGMLDNWKTFARQLAEDYTVFIVDLRNHGKSPHDEDMSYEAMAEDVAKLLEDQWIYQATVIGHSMGGKVAMRLALDHPELVGGLVIVDIAAKAYPPHHLSVMNALNAVHLDSVSTRQQIQDQMAQFLDDQSTLLFLMKNVKRTGDTFTWKMNKDVLVDKYHQINVAITSESTYDGPVLIVSGGNSNYVAEEDIQQSQALFPEVKGVVIDGAGHWVHADNPEELLQVVKSFIGHDDVS